MSELIQIDELKQSLSHMFELPGEVWIMGTILVTIFAAIYFLIWKMNDLIMEGRTAKTNLEARLRLLELNQQGAAQSTKDNAEFLRCLKITGRYSETIHFDQYMRNIVATKAWITAKAKDGLQQLQAPTNVDKANCRKGDTNELIIGTQTKMTESITLLMHESTVLRNSLKSNPFKFSTSAKRIKYLKTISNVELKDSDSEVSFGNRIRPSIRGDLRGQDGVTSIVFFGETTGSFQSNANFSDTVIGNILHMAQTFFKIQPWRSVLFSFVTDTRRFQFFKTIETDIGFYHEATFVHTGIIGWQILIGMLQINPSALGYSNMTIDGVSFKELLGVGRQTYVFSAAIAELLTTSMNVNMNKDVVIKIYPDEQVYEQEKATLQFLSQQVSKKQIFFPQIVMMKEMRTRNGYYAIALSPRCQLVQPCHGAVEMVYGKDIVQLLELLEEVHRVGLVHRDIKPQNILRTENGNIFLNDWGSAAYMTTTVKWEGTPLFYNVRNELYYPKAADDLIALAKTAYLMLYNLQLPLTTTPIQLSNKVFIDGVPLWKDILEHSKNCNYTVLKQLYAGLK